VHRPAILSQPTQRLVANVSLIAIVDDDDSVRQSVRSLLASLGFAVEACSSAEEFLSSPFLERTDCLIADVRMPGMSGLELQQELVVRQYKIPIVFITAYGKEDIHPRAFANGAVDCLLKPFSEEALLNAVDAALRPR
jgi:FixJ family two-component response regulator